MHPGTDVEITLREDEVVLRPASATQPLRGRFAGSGMAANLLSDRQAEAR